MGVLRSSLGFDLAIVMRMISNDKEWNYRMGMSHPMPIDR